MKLEEANTLEGYVRHAEYYGTDEVFETACDGGLPLRDLGFLALRLQNLDSKWKLTADAQQLFVLALLFAGCDVKDAARMAGVSRATAQRWATDSLHAEDYAAYFGGQVPEVDPEMALRRASMERFEHLRGIVRGWRRTA